MEELAGFGERLLAIIDDGRRTATYKLALLLALIDACAENADEAGAAPAELSTRVIARRVAEVYWLQLRPYPTGEDVRVLRQITNKRSTILTAVAAIGTEVGAVSFTKATGAAGFERMLDAVELTVARYPLRLLQTVDNVPQPFIYDVSWTEHVSLSQLRRSGMVVFHPGAADQLVRLAPLVRPLVELHWTRMVSELNQLALDEQRLHDHLFGVERQAFPPKLRWGLTELQAGGCFYCGQPISGRADVDHFIPWARYPNDSIENLVVADPVCNNHKRDRIAGVRLLERWCERLQNRHDDLISVAGSASWQHARERSAGLTRSVYAHLPAGAPLWAGPGVVEPADLSIVTNALMLCG